MGFIHINLCECKRKSVIFQLKDIGNEIANIGMDATTHGISGKNASKFIDISYQANSNLRYEFLKIRKYLDNWKNKTLKWIVLFCHHKAAEIKYNSKFEQW